ncbi:MAG TPA: ACP S-malonyltransferase [Nitrospiria bacterium]|nr:ACP S-malonyltransferase [Nitrospiria bacterium]
MTVAFLFPGQGSQYVGMGEKLFAASDVARQVYRTAQEVLKFDIATVCHEGPADRLNLTEHTQPAILTTSIAAWRMAQERGLSASTLAGHSLGEYTALVAAGGLAFSDAVTLVQKRGRYMQEAVPEGSGAMAAILGLDRGTVEEICKAASGHGVVSAANINSRVQIVIGGNRPAVEAAMALAKERGAKRIVPLAVSVPSHCALMKPAAERLARDLDGVKFLPLQVPVVTNVEAAPIVSGDLAKKALVRQLVSPVLWVDTVERMIQEGVTAFVEIGPGTVLSGLVKRIDRNVKTYHIEDPETLDETLDALTV